MKDCIFCKIVTGEFDSHCIYEDEFFKVILDKFPASKGHALILTKAHYDESIRIVALILLRDFLNSDNTPVSSTTS